MRKHVPILRLNVLIVIARCSKAIANLAKAAIMLTTLLPVKAGTSVGFVGVWVEIVCIASHAMRSLRVAMSVNGARSILQAPGKKKVSYTTKLVVV